MDAGAHLCPTPESGLCLTTPWLGRAEGLLSLSYPIYTAAASLQGCSHPLPPVLGDGSFSNHCSPEKPMCQTTGTAMLPFGVLGSRSHTPSTWTPREVTQTPCSELVEGETTFQRASPAFLGIPSFFRVYWGGSWESPSGCPTHRL